MVACDLIFDQCAVSIVSLLFTLHLRPHCDTESETNPGTESAPESNKFISGPWVMRMVHSFLSSLVLQANIPTNQQGENITAEPHGIGRSNM